MPLENFYYPSWAVGSQLPYRSPLPEDQTKTPTIKLMTVDIFRPDVSISKLGSFHENPFTSCFLAITLLDLSNWLSKNIWDKGSIVLEKLEERG